MKFFKNILKAFWQIVVVVWRDGFLPLLKWGWKNKVKFAIISLTTLFALGVTLRECGRALDAGRVMEERAKNSELENLRKERDELRSKLAVVVTTPASTPAPVPSPSPTPVVVEKKGKPEDVDGVGLKIKTSTLSEVPVGAKVVRSVPKTVSSGVQTQQKPKVMLGMMDPRKHYKYFEKSGVFKDLETGVFFTTPPNVYCYDTGLNRKFYPFGDFAKSNLESDRIRARELGDEFWMQYPNAKTVWVTQ